MENNAVISIRTKQEIDGDTETIELDTVGKFAIRNEKVYIIYSESEMTGFKDTTTTIKVAEDCVSVSRSGRYKSKITYNTGETGLCMVNTPYGQIGAAIKTESINSDFNIDGGVLKMDYKLDADNVNFIRNNMTIKVTLDN